MKNLFLILLPSLILIGCVSDYEKGKQALNNSDLKKAKQYFQNVTVDGRNKDYDSALSKLHEIKEIEINYTFNYAIKQFSYGSYNNSKTAFSKIEPNHKLYPQAISYITKIDSIILEEGIKLKNEQKVKIAKQEAREKIELDENQARSAKTIIVIKKEIRILFDELMAFRGRKDFFDYGFGKGGPYYSWLERVGQLKDLERTTNGDFWMETEFTTGDLETLGLEYIDWDGRETEYSRYMITTINNGLK